MFPVEGRVLSQVTQIAAVEVQSGSQFATYVTPAVPISQEASQVTGISMTDGTMTVN
jgi:DNA polymerase III epsilon subunit-like protein